MIILLVLVSTVWGYGILAVTVISLTSLVGVATIPFFGKKMYKKILATLVALAVGTLAGDSLLHLLPHVWTILLICNIYCVLYNNQINARALSGQSAVYYCAGKPTEKSRIF